MLEQNKSPPAITAPKRYKESWMNDPSEALRVQGILALAIIGGGILAGVWIIPKERLEEQNAVNEFLKHSQQSEAVTKADFTLLKADLETDIRKMLSENAQRPGQRADIKKTDHSPKP